MAGVASTVADSSIAARDHRDEFGELCRSVHPRLVGALALRCGDRQLGEDLAQEALARAWRDWPRLRERGPVEPWVFATAFNMLRSWHRRLRVARRREPLLAVVPAEHDAAGGIDVRRAVALLPERQREAIALRYYADLSVRDTAVVMGCAEGTVRALTSQAVSGLKTSLGHAIELTDEEADR